MLLRDGAGASAAVAALGHPLLQAGILTGRAGADRIRARAGAATVIVWCGTGVAVVCALLVAVPAVPVVLTAVYLTGVAVSPVLPLVFSLAGSVRPDPGRRSPRSAPRATRGCSRDRQCWASWAASCHCRSRSVGWSSCSAPSSRSPAAVPPDHGYRVN
ncbi:hypothetical protein [Dactylosporangium cerinum]